MGEAAFRVMFLTYEEAQLLLPIFRQLSTREYPREMRMAASRIVEKLRRVREDVDYRDTGGEQICLKERDFGLLSDVLEMVGVR